MFAQLNVKCDSKTETQDEKKAFPVNNDTYDSGGLAGGLCELWLGRLTGGFGLSWTLGVFLVSNGDTELWASLRLRLIASCISSSSDRLL